jgi:hypothetical protein
MPYNFLVVSWAAPGDLGPMLSGARQLRDRGHDVSLHCAFGRTRTGRRRNSGSLPGGERQAFLPLENAADGNPRYVYDNFLFGPACAMPPIAVMNLIARQLTRSLLMTVYLGAQWRPRLGSVIAAEFSACSNSHRTDETQARITSACVRQQCWLGSFQSLQTSVMPPWSPRIWPMFQPRPGAFFGCRIQIGRAALPRYFGSWKWLRL